MQRHSHARQAVTACVKVGSPERDPRGCTGLRASLPCSRGLGCVQATQRWARHWLECRAACANPTQGEPRFAFVILGCGAFPQGGAPCLISSVRTPVCCKACWCC
jgi:hypothetical protein